VSLSAVHDTAAAAAELACHYFLISNEA